MAKNVKATPVATAPAAQSAAVDPNAGALNSEVLARVYNATKAGGYDFVTQAEGAGLLAAGLITINTEIANGTGGYAAKTTSHGNEVAGEHEADDASATASASKFEIDDNVPLANKKTGGGGGKRAPRESIYPFDQLAVGQSFHIKATEKMPKPNRTIASAVSIAIAKHSVPVLDANGVAVTETFTRKNKAGEVLETGTRPKMQPTRVFTTRAVDDSDPRGAGARVYRVEDFKPEAPATEAPAATA